MSQSCVLIGSTEHDEVRAVWRQRSGHSNPEPVSIASPRHQLLIQVALLCSPADCFLLVLTLGGEDWLPAWVDAVWGVCHVGKENSEKTLRAFRFQKPTGARYDYNFMWRWEENIYIYGSILVFVMSEQVSVALLVRAERCRPSQGCSLLLIVKGAFFREWSISESR